MSSSKYVVSMHLDMGYNTNSNSQFALFGEQAGAVSMLNGEHDQLHHAFVEDIKSSGMEQLARDSGLLSEKDSIPTLRVVMPSRKEIPAEPTEVEDSSASFTSPVKRGRGRARGAPGDKGSASKRSKSRRSKSSGSQGSQSHSVPTKGLRHFSLAVCNKVRDKGVTTYNEVADELVADFDDEESKNDEKNIRRRVYDALNVLSAMDIIRKVKKDIHWVGLPTSNSIQLQGLEEEQASRAERVAKKEEHLLEISNQLHLYKTLIDRNAKRPVPNDEKLSLPFIIVNADHSSKIDLRVSADRTEYVFDFTNPFEIRDDPDILLQVLEPPPLAPTITQTTAFASKTNE